MFPEKSNGDRNLSDKSSRVTRNHRNLSFSALERHKTQRYKLSFVKSLTFTSKILFKTCVIVTHSDISTHSAPDSRQLFLLHKKEHFFTLTIHVNLFNVTSATVGIVRQRSLLKF